MLKNKHKIVKHIVMSALTVSLCAALFSIPNITFAAAKNDVSKKQDNGKPYFESYSINPESSIGVSGINGNWAACTTVEGKTYQEQLDNKLAYIEQLYQDEKEIFIIKEGISSEEVTNTDAVRYMYDTSSVYRKLVTVNDVLYIQSKCSFGLLANEGQSTLYDRYVFSLEEEATLKLQASYKLQQGKMAICIVSPDGKLIYQNDAGTDFDQTIQLSLDKGLYSVILVYEMKDRQVDGEMFVQGDFIY